MNRKEIFFIIIIITMCTLLVGYKCNNFVKIWGQFSETVDRPIKVDSSGVISGLTSENLVLTSISTEYSKAFTSAKKITFQNRGSETIKYAYETGVVATGEAIHWHIEWRALSGDGFVEVYTP